MKLSPSAWLGLGMLAVYLLAGLLGPVIAPDSSDPNCRPATVITGNSALRSA